MDLRGEDFLVDGGELQSSEKKKGMVDLKRESVHVGRGLAI